jgi:hypothetical protein
MIDAVILLIVKAFCLLLMLATLAVVGAWWMIYTPANGFAELLLFLMGNKDAR